MEGKVLLTDGRLVVEAEKIAVLLTTGEFHSRAYKFYDPGLREPTWEIECLADSKN